MKFNKLSPERLIELRKQFNEYPEATKENMCRLGLAPKGLWEDLSTHKLLTCVNHPYVRYTTKNPWTRSVFLLQGPYGLPASIDDECECPWSDIRLVVGDE